MLPFGPHGDSRHFHVFGGHVTFLPKTNNSKLKKYISVKYRTKRVALNPSDTGNLVKSNISDLSKILS